MKGFRLSTRTKARVTVLVGLILVMLGRLAYLQADLSQGPELSPLPEEQIISRATLQSNDCEQLALRANRQGAERVFETEQQIIEPERAALIADSALMNNTGQRIDQLAHVSEPILLDADFERFERLVYARVWVLDADPSSTASVVYVDAIGALPLFLYTDIPVESASAMENCIAPVSRVWRYSYFPPVLVLMAAGLIVAGVSWEYVRTRRLIASASLPK